MLSKPLLHLSLSKAWDQAYYLRLAITADQCFVEWVYNMQWNFSNEIFYAVRGLNVLISPEACMGYILLSCSLPD